MINRQPEKLETKRANIFIVDDHPIVRQGVSGLINQQDDVIVSREFEGGREALEALSSELPDLMIIDISLKDMDGLSLIKQIKAANIDVPMLVLSMYDEMVYAKRAFCAGAKGYIMKEVVTDTILIAIRKILAGHFYVSDKLTDSIVKLYAKTSILGEIPIYDLTEREQEVFELIGQGLKSTQIAEKLHVSIKTIETHQSHIKEKLDVKTPIELHQLAREWALSCGDYSG